MVKKLGAKGKKSLRSTRVSGERKDLVKFPAMMVEENRRNGREDILWREKKNHFTRGK